MQAMGRKIGFIPAAARLADPEREMPLLICLAESQCPLAQLADRVNDQLRRSGRCMVVVSEGFDVGDLGEVTDAFGHTSFGSGRSTVAQAVVGYLNQMGLPCKGTARGNIPGTDQRHSMAYASAVDIDEAYRVGSEGGRTGRGRPKRLHGHDPPRSRPDRTACVTTKCRWPRWPTASGRSRRTGSPPADCDVTDDFVRYARPLVGDGMIVLPLIDGRQRMTRFKPSLRRAETASQVRYPKPTRQVTLIDRSCRFHPKHEFLVGIDSDGCAFDTMELKHKECFIPNTINYWGLQGVSQLRPRGGRVRQSLLEKPGHQSVSRRWSKRWSGPTAARGQGPRRRRRRFRRRCWIG